MSSATANPGLAEVEDLELSSSATWGASRFRSVARRDVVGVSFATTDLGPKQNDPSARTGMEIPLPVEAGVTGHLTGSRGKPVDAAYVYASGMRGSTSMLDAVLRAWESGSISGHAEAVVTLSDTPRNLLTREFNVVWPKATDEPELAYLAALLAMPQSAETRQDEGAAAVGKLFNELATEWKRATLNTSSMTRMVLHPAYQRIVGIGPSVLQSLLAELQREPDWWFAALKAITGADPVPADERGDLVAMTKRWIAWGRIHGYVRE